MIRIPQKIYDAIKELARKDAPNETCGYLGGTGDTVTELFGMTNVDHSPEHFSFDPEEQFKVMERTEELGIQILAVYHSHPETPARMSQEDLRLSFDTSIVYLIYSLLTDELKAFKVNRDKQAGDFPIEVIP